MQHQRLELREVEVLRLDLDVTRRRLPLQRERAGHVERLLAADEPHILELDAILGVLDGGFRARRAGPLHALRPDRECRQVHFLVIGMENQLAGGVELAALFLDVRRERQPLLRVRRLGGDRVQLKAAGLDEGGGRRRPAPAPASGRGRACSRCTCCSDPARCSRRRPMLLPSSVPVVFSSAALPLIVPSRVAAPLTFAGRPVSRAPRGRWPRRGTSGSSRPVLSSATRPEASTLTSGPLTCSRFRSAVCAA